MAETVYLLCALTSIVCAGLLIRSYRRSRTPLLLWSSLCFVGLAINNALLFVDLVLLVNEVELALVRSTIGLVSLLILIFGLIWHVH
jgi:hypothetical protein